MIDKKLVKERFTKKLESYDHNAIVQKQMANYLTTLLDSKMYDNILEFGSGTGFLTRTLNANLSFKSYTAVDIVAVSEKYLKQINHNINFISDDMEKYVQYTNKKFDLIISNATFQWLEDIDVFFKNIINKLSTNGILLFSTFGQNNFKEIECFLNQKINYNSTSQLKEILPNAEIFSENLSLDFESPIDVLKHIKYTGVNCINRTIWTKRDLTNFCNQYPRTEENNIKLTYNPIYVKYKKD